MVRQFQRRAHHYLRDLPPLQQELDWLALIQHYGGPTRLLDFSHSFYVAAFFAMERAQADAAIWAVDLEALKETIASQTKVDTSKETTDDVNKRHVALANSVLRKKKKLPGVIDVEPDQLHERQTIQQGFFLFPSDTSIPFEANLAKTYGVDPSTFAKPATDLWCDVKNKFYSETERPTIMKINIPRTCHYQGMSDLEQMNITAATLFPGLDGFSRSLYFYLRMDISFDWLADSLSQLPDPSA